MCANCKFKVYMKHFNTILLFASMFCSAIMLHSCTADVDLNNIDTTTSVKANLAMPIGRISANIGDFVGDGSFGIYVDSLDHRGVLTFRDTFSIAREFHKLDLSQYLSNTTLKMNVYDKMSAFPFFTDGKITGNDSISYTLEFPLTIKLQGINYDESYQRLDSALIRNASFISQIGRSEEMPLKWEWIDKVTLDLGSVFHRPAGNSIVVYKRGDGYGYDQFIDINVDEFSINLMKNQNPGQPELYFGNVIDSCNVTIKMQITVPSSAGQISIPNNSEFQYHLGVRFVDYHAVWGMFYPSDDMSDENEVNIAELWDGWNAFTKVNLPFFDPKIDVNITTEIAGALQLHGDYLYAEDNAGERVNATFNGSTTLEHYFSSSEYLPLDSEIGKAATMSILFDKDPRRGHIDNLFKIHPEKLGYKFAIDFNRQKTPQIRITNNTDVKIDAVCTLPLMFNQGVVLGYSDTIQDVDLSILSLDSLMGNVEVLDSLDEATLKLALKIENTIPLQFKGEFDFIDEAGNVLISADSVLIPAPEHKYNQTTANWDVTPSAFAELITIQKEDLEKLSNVRRIVFNISMDDESLQYAYEEGNFHVKLTEQEMLRIAIGVGADVKAILNMNSLIGL